MSAHKRRDGDRRVKIERRKETTSLINNFIGHYGPDRRSNSDRRYMPDRRS